MKIIGEGKFVDLVCYFMLQLILGTSEYNMRLEKIYKKYQQKKSDSFAVIFQKVSVDFSACPDDYFRYAQKMDIN